MIKEKKLSLRVGIFAGLISLAFLGSTAGSLAWYAYSRTVMVSFTGTTVSSSALLNVGLVDNGGFFEDADLVTYSLDREDATDGEQTNSIVWSKSRSGFSLTAIQHYLNKSEYAVDTLKPVTTGSREYDDTSDLVLYRAPEFGETSFEVEAQKNNYVVLPFAFRILDENSDYVAGKNIWLTDTTVKAEDDADKSVRLFVKGENTFLMQPADKENDVGETKVGGVLSIGPGEYYDFDVSTNKEFCYGEFDETTISYSALDNEDYDVLYDMNDVEDQTLATTFHGKHWPGVLVPNIAAASPKVQEHAGMGKVKPSVSSVGQLYTDTTNGNGIPVALTSNESKVGYTTITVFIEGWDHAVIDQRAGYLFNLGLTFEIDRI